MRLNKKYVRFISLVLIASFIHYCISYNKVILPKTQLKIKNKTILVHYRGITQLLQTPKLENNQLSGIVKYDLPSTNENRDVHIYLDPNVETKITMDEQLIIPFDRIVKIEVYDIAVGKSIIYTIFTLAAIVGIIFLIILLTKDSCPFVYAFNGIDYEFIGEIYSGAIFPQLERHDYLTLPVIKEVDSEYKIKLANKVHEIQFTNMTELFVFEHPLQSEVVVDKYGTPHTLTNVQKPISATNLKAEIVNMSIQNKDSLFYMGAVSSSSDDLMDGMVLKFKRPENAKMGKLVIRAKNSFWLDHINGEFYSLFGDVYDEWYEDQKDTPLEEMIQWSLDQGIPLSVYLEQEGEWQYLDYYNIVGPLAMKDDILAIDISSVKTEEVCIKLEFGYLFWEIDYVGMDFSEDLEMNQKTLLPKAAYDQDDQEVISLLSRDDDQYQVMDTIDDEVILTFNAPVLSENLNHTIVLHSKGHYEILRDPQGNPDISYLTSFKKPGKFVEFSNQRYLELVKDLGN